LAASRTSHHDRARELREQLSWRRLAAFCALAAVAAVLITVAVSLAAVASSRW